MVHSASMRRVRAIAALVTVGLTSVMVTLAPAAHATVFTNASGISIPSAPGFSACFSNPGAPAEVTPASPYPSQIGVSGLGQSVQDVNVTVSLGVIGGFGGGIAGGDLDILLVGPSGASTILTADNGYDYPASNVVLTFDDEAAAPLPNFPAPLQPGTYKPSINTVGGNSCTHPASFPAPAPPGPYGTPSLTVFDGSNPNGAWSLFVISDTARNGAVGTIASWSLDITASTTYSVSPFSQPVDNDVPNYAKAGAIVPLKFRVTDAGGAPVTTLSVDQVRVTSTLGATDCGENGDAIERYVGRSGLQNLGDGYYQYNWATSRSFRGQCRTMTLSFTTADGQRSAAFIFR